MDVISQAFNKINVISLKIAFSGFLYLVNTLTVIGIIMNVCVPIKHFCTNQRNKSGNFCRGCWSRILRVNPKRETQVFPSELSDEAKLAPRNPARGVNEPCARKTYGAIARRGGPHRLNSSKRTVQRLVKRLLTRG